MKKEKIKIGAIVYFNEGKFGESSFMYPNIPYKIKGEIDGCFILDQSYGPSKFKQKQSRLSFLKEKFYLATQKKGRTITKSDIVNLISDSYDAGIAYEGKNINQIKKSIFKDFIEKLNL